MRIEPATINQVITGRGGRKILVEDDVCGVAKQLKEIDDRLALEYNESGEYFMILLLGAGLGGRPHCVTTCQELHGGVVEHIRRLANGTYDVGAEGDQIDRQADANNDWQFRENVGEISEKLAHAIRTDLKKGHPGPVYLPPDVY